MSVVLSAAIATTSTTDYLLLRLDGTTFGSHTTIFWEKCRNVALEKPRSCKVQDVAAFCGCTAVVVRLASLRSKNMKKWCVRVRMIAVNVLNRQRAEGDLSVRVPYF